MKSLYSQKLQIHTHTQHTHTHTHTLKQKILKKRFNCFIIYHNYLIENKDHSITITVTVYRPEYKIKPYLNIFLVFLFSKIQNL